MPVEFVWLVCNKDYGDNGWSVWRIFLTREEAEHFVNDNPQRFGYWDIEKHAVGKGGDMIGGSEIYEEET